MARFKKILFFSMIVVVFVFAASFAKAARLAPGSVPLEHPLQPMPLDVAPNYSENINTPPKETPPSSMPAGPESQPGPSEQAPQTKPASQKTPWPFAILGGLILLGGLGYWMYRKTTKSKPK